MKRVAFDKGDLQALVSDVILPEVPFLNKGPVLDEIQDGVVGKTLVGCFARDLRGHMRCLSPCFKLKGPGSIRP